MAKIPPETACRMGKPPTKAGNTTAPNDTAPDIQKEWYTGAFYAIR